MQKFIVEVSDASHAALQEPVFLEHPRDLAAGVKQAVEDFIEAHHGQVSTPLRILARTEYEEESPCFSAFAKPEK